MFALPLLSPPHSGPLTEIDGEITRITDALRRSIGLVGHAYATEETYVHWATRFTRFCLIRLKQTPQNAVPNGITTLLDYLALERNVAPATQSQALNALSFLTKNVLGLKEVTLDHITPAHGQRRPPVVMTGAEVRSAIAHLENSWKLAAQLMYGSGLRLMETLRLRVKDLDFGQGTITVHDGKGGRHRVVTLPKSLEQRLTDYLATAHKKHLQDRTVQSLLGHTSVETTMIYLHVMKRPGAGAPSPPDLD
jgi:integrase